MKELTLLAENGDAEAQFSLGVMNDLGQGVPQSYKKAVLWCRKAAEHGNAEARCSAELHGGGGMVCKAGAQEKVNPKYVQAKAVVEAKAAAEAKIIRAWPL